MANHYTILRTKQANHELFLRSLTFTMMMVVVTSSSIQTFPVSSNLPEVIKRHAYANAIPFNDMKLDAKIVTSLSGLSRGRCVMECLHKTECQAINYRTTDSTCDLLSDYLCAGNSYLVSAAGYCYFDVEKNGQITSIDKAASEAACRTDAICSPKCNCHLGFLPYPQSMLALPEPEEVSANNSWKCKKLCLTKPLDQCRSVNFKPSTKTCELLQSSMQESFSSFFNDNEWEHHERACVIAY